MAIQANLTTQAENREPDQLPEAEMLHCYLIKTNQELFKTSGDNIFVNNIKFMALKDSCSQVTLCHPDIVPQECILKGESMTVKGIGEAAVILPVAEIPIRYQGWEGKWRSGVAAQLPAAVLIGIDLTKYVKRVLVQTRSQKKMKGQLRKKMKFLWR